MKYLCLVYVEPRTMTRLSPSELARLDRDSIAYDKELARRRCYLASDALQPVASARTVRVRRGKLR